MQRPWVPLPRACTCLRVLEPRGWGGGERRGALRGEGLGEGGWETQGARARLGSFQKAWRGAPGAAGRAGEGPEPSPQDLGVQTQKSGGGQTTACPASAPSGTAERGASQGGGDPACRDPALTCGAGSGRALAPGGGPGAAAGTRTPLRQVWEEPRREAALGAIPGCAGRGRGCIGAPDWPAPPPPSPAPFLERLTGWGVRPAGLQHQPVPRSPVQGSPVPGSHCPGVARPGGALAEVALPPCRPSLGTVGGAPGSEG